MPGQSTKEKCPANNSKGGRDKYLPGKLTIIEKLSAPDAITRNE